MPKNQRKVKRPERLEPLGQQLDQDKLSQFATSKSNQSNYNNNLSKVNQRKVLRDQIMQLKNRKSKKGMTLSEDEKNKREAKKIMQLADDQMEEIENPDNHEDDNKGFRDVSEDDMSDFENDENEDLEEFNAYEKSQEEFFTEVLGDNDDINIMDNFFGEGNAPVQKRTLADIISEKMAEHEAQKKVEQQAEQVSGMSPKIVEIYTNVGKIMSKYRSGKVPKALKVVPNLMNWTEILEVMNIWDFSNQGIYVLTRIFISSLNNVNAEVYLKEYLLPRVKQDIKANKTLNYHLYQSLQKALYKPIAFYKGVVLALVEDPQTNLKEAVVIASVLNKNTVPMLHSAAAILKISQLPYFNFMFTDAAMLRNLNVSPVLVILKVLLNKKYNLPLKVVEQMVIFFMRFARLEPKQIDSTDKSSMPVLWHQCLLVFVQRYKSVFTEDQRTGIRMLVKKHFHPQITSEIRRELLISNNSSLEKQS